MNYYVRRGFNKDLLPKSVPKQGRWLKKTKNKGEQRPFNIWFQNKLQETNMSVSQFTMRLNKMFPEQPKTDEGPVRFWTIDTIPRAKSQIKIAQVIAKSLKIQTQDVMNELVNVIENEIPVQPNTKINEEPKTKKKT
jgi:hypothetical protein